MNLSQYIFYISLLLAYEVVFLSTFYLKFFYSGEAQAHLVNFDTIFISEHMSWFLLGRFHSIGILLSWSNRSAQQQLLNRMAALDSRLKSQLQVDLSLRQLNIEFIIYSGLTTIYHYTYYVSEGIIHGDELVSLIYYFCCTSAAVFYYIYALYTVYWARAFVTRAEHILDALRAVTSQTYISKPALAVVMELIKLLFGVRESIQDAFGSTLCIVFMMNSFLIAVSMFGVIDDFERHREINYFCVSYFIPCVSSKMYKSKPANLPRERFFFATIRNL